MKRSGLRTRSIPATLLAAIPLCGLLLFASCSSSDKTMNTEGDSPLESSKGTAPATMSAIPDSSNTGHGDVVTGPTGGSRINREVGLTVGERLKQLDLRMQTAPPDSLGILMAEYERLLDSAMGTGGGSTPSQQTTTSSTPVAVQPQESNASYPRSTPRSSLKGNTDDRIQSDIGSGNDSDLDPAKFGGVRENDYYRENTPAQPPTPAATPSSIPASQPVKNSTNNTGKDPAGSSTVASTSPSTSRPTSGQTEEPSQKGVKKSKGKKGKAAAKGKKGRKGTKSRSTEAPSTPLISPEPASKSSSLNENYTEGLAHFRAGRYKQAIASLKPVANSSSSYRTTAKYYYALSLERTGSLQQAAAEFRSLSKGSGSLADKGWVGYCRVLHAQGKKNEAKKELLRLIKQRPQSSQIAVAKQLLQKL